MPFGFTNVLASYKLSVNTVFDEQSSLVYLVMSLRMVLKLNIFFLRYFIRCDGSWTNGNWTIFW